VSALLDTNVLSELLRAMPNPAVVAWVIAQPGESLFVTSVTEAEMRLSVRLLPAGKRRQALEIAVAAIFAEDFAGRIRPFDTAAAPSYVALNGPREYLGLLSATQELDLSGRLRAARARARADQLAATANLGISQRDLRRIVSVSYHRALLTRHLAAAAREALSESQSFEARTRLLFEQGEAARADVVKAAAQTAFSEQAVAASDLDSEIANHELLSFWTKDVSASVTLQPSLSRPVRTACETLGSSSTTRIRISDRV
jgi:outer membrane protein TolC